MARKPSWNPVLGSGALCVPCVGVGVALVDDDWAAVDGGYRAVACSAIELVAVRGLFGGQGAGVKRC